MGVLRHVVVVVPGIGGSVLSGLDGCSAWDLTARAVTHAVIDPGVLDIDRELVATGLVDTLTVFRPWLVVPGYDGLTQHLRTSFGDRLQVVDYREGEPVPGGVDVLRVPYDFRRSIAVSADVLGRAVSAAVGESGRQVIVVAHSMGGLVARYWIGVCGGWRHCRALLTLGTPHRGAPRALDWLFNGAGAGILRSGAATRELRRWPSMFELLPQYPAVLPEVGEPVEPRVLSPSLVRPFGSSDAGGQVLGRVGEAVKIQADIAAAWEQIPGGRGHKTPNRAAVRGGRIRVQKVDPSWRGNVGWAGDGTVPAISAIPAELSREPERAQAVPDTHGAMGSTAAVLQHLVTMQGENLPIRSTSDRPAKPWVGWDVEEIAPAGTQVEVGAQVHHGSHGPREVVGSAATLVVSGGVDRLVVAMTAGEQGWRAVLPPLAVGLYQVDVEVTGAWHETPVWASTPLAIVDTDTDDGGAEGGGGRDRVAALASG
jgi:hypothetical protein